MDIRFYFFWVISKQGDARLCDMCMLNFGRNSETGFWAVGPSTFLAALYESSNCSKTSLTLGIASHVYFSSSIRYVVVSYSFNLYLPYYNDSEHFFMYLFTIHRHTLVKCSNFLPI